MRDENTDRCRFKPVGIALLMFLGGCNHGYLGGCGGDAYLTTPDRELPLGDLVCIPNPDFGMLGSDYCKHAGADNGELGAAFATGDFDDDSYPDLVVGAPGCDGADPLGNILPQAGKIIVCFGGPPDPSGSCGFMNENCIDVEDPAGPRTGARFGAALAAFPIVPNPDGCGSPGATVHSGHVAAAS